MSFSELGLSPELLRAVADSGYETPTPVQREAIPLILAGRDLMAGAQTGTGKTAAFVLPILQRLHTRASPAIDRRAVRALVVVPTRELAIQVEESVRTYGRHWPMRSVAVYGGVGLADQLRELEAGAEFVVATPGRLLDLVWRGSIDFGSVEFLVLDEADRMLDMGFIDDIRQIIALLPDERQSLLFSATFPSQVQRLAKSLLRNPAVVQVTPRNTAAELVRHLVIPAEDDQKRAVLSRLVRARRVNSALVFVRTKHGADRLARHLTHDGIRVATIHSNKTQPQRVAALEDFKAGRVTLLVATEVAARGIDIDALPHVINYDAPRSAEDYVHRIGRTGRAGIEGDAISLVSSAENRYLRDIERLLGRTIPVEPMDGVGEHRTTDPRQEPARPAASVGGRPSGAPPRRSTGQRRVGWSSRSERRPVSSPTATARGADAGARRHRS